MLVLAAQDQRDSAGAQVSGHLRGVIGLGHPRPFQRLRQDVAAGERMSGGIASLPPVLIQPGATQLGDDACPAGTPEHMMQIEPAPTGGENRRRPRWWPGAGSRLLPGWVAVLGGVGGGRPVRGAWRAGREGVEVFAGAADLALGDGLAQGGWEPAWAPQAGVHQPG